MEGMEAREIYRDLIEENIDYEILADDPQIDRGQLDEILEIILDTVCTSRKTVRIAGADFPAEVVHSQYLKLNASHIRYAMDCLMENTTRIRNSKKYLLENLLNGRELFALIYKEKFPKTQPALTPFRAGAGFAVILLIPLSVEYREFRLHPDFPERPPPAMRMRRKTLPICK